jgi:hypothetical protein
VHLGLQRTPTLVELTAIQPLPARQAEQREVIGIQPHAARSFA